MQSVTGSSLMKLGAFGAAVLCAAVTADEEAGLAVSAVSFNPSVGQSVELRFAARQGAGANPTSATRSTVEHISGPIGTITH